MCDNLGIDLLVEQERVLVCFVPYPDGQSIISVLDLIVNLDGQLHTSMVRHVDEPSPELRHAIECVIKVIRRYKDIRV